MTEVMRMERHKEDNIVSVGEAAVRNQAGVCPCNIIPIFALVCPCGTIPLPRNLPPCLIASCVSFIAALCTSVVFRSSQLTNAEFPQQFSFEFLPRICESAHSSLRDSVACVAAELWRPPPSILQPSSPERSRMIIIGPFFPVR